MAPSALQLPPAAGEHWGGHAKNCDRSLPWKIAFRPVPGSCGGGLEKGTSGRRVPASGTPRRERGGGTSCMEADPPRGEARWEVAQDLEPRPGLRRPGSVALADLQPSVPWGFASQPQATSPEMAATSTALPTHHWQMASRTNSSTAVR